MKQKFLRTVGILLCACLLLLPLCACTTRSDPLAKTGIASLTLSKKGKLAAEVTVDSETLEEKDGQRLQLYALAPGEALADLAAREPLAAKKAASHMEFSAKPEKGETFLYSSFVFLWEDGTPLTDAPQYIQNPEVTAPEKGMPTPTEAPKGIVSESIAVAEELCASHAVHRVSLAELSAGTDVFPFYGTDIGYSAAYLEGVVTNAVEAANAGLSVSLCIEPDGSLSSLSLAAMAELLASELDKTVATVFAGASESTGAEDAARLARYAFYAFRSRNASAQVYIDAPTGTLQDTVTFYTDAAKCIEAGGLFEWGASVRAGLGDGLSAREYDDIAAFLTVDLGEACAARLCFTLPAIAAETEDRQAAQLCLAWRLAQKEQASMILYPTPTSDETGFYNSDGEARRAASVFAELDEKLSEETQELCKRELGTAWTILDHEITFYRESLGGVANVGTAQLSGSALFDFSDGDTLGFTGVNTASAPFIKSSNAGTPVLYTQLTPTAQTGGVRKTLDKPEEFSDATSLCAHLLVQLPRSENAPVVKLTLTGTSVAGKQLRYTSQIAVENNRWQAITFQIASFTSKMDPKAPCTVALSVEGGADADETRPPVLWLHGMELRYANAGGSLPVAFWAVGAVILTFAVCFGAYLLTARRRRR